LPEVKSVQTLVGSKVNIGGTGSMGGETQTHVGQLIVELVESDKREDTKQRSSEQLLTALRAYSVTLKGINSVQWEAFSGGPAGKDVEIRLIVMISPAGLIAHPNLSPKWVKIAQ
jgi:hypothetical protein